LPIKELSVFIDESGDFGVYHPASPYYLVALLMHDQSTKIESSVRRLGDSVRLLGFPQPHAIHTGPLVRREGDYANHPLELRKRLFNALFAFARTTDYRYRCLLLDKRHLKDRIELNAGISRQLAAFLTDNIDRFRSYHRIIVYYDNGQTDLTHIIVSIFSVYFANVEFRKIIPVDYRFAQVVDMLCSLSLFERKAADKHLSRSEMVFFQSAKELERNYLRYIKRKCI